MIKFQSTLMGVFKQSHTSRESFWRFIFKLIITVCICIYYKLQLPGEDILNICLLD